MRLKELKDILQTLSEEDNNWFSITIREALRKGWEPPPLKEMLEGWKNFIELEKEYCPLEDRSLEDDVSLVKGNYAQAAYEFLNK